jgi:GAF domain-containing protein
MTDKTKSEALALADDDVIRGMLAQVCAMTDMGFAAVARVTQDRWIACQVLDKIEFGLEPGSELAIKKTICDEIRDSKTGVIIDDVDAEEPWRTHPVPIIYGFKSYISLPIILPDGSFFGTLCAIDPVRRSISSHDAVRVMTAFAAQIGELIAAEYQTT